ncbi:DUF2321 domain-containing protein [Chloroflexota bacterium]
MGVYRTAEVCPNGHVSTNSADEYPERREKFCSKCGEPTITQCPHCNTNIRGYYYVEGFIQRHEYEPPAFCFNCGSPFPWTERKLAAAFELVKANGNLSDEELAQFRDDLDELTKDSPRVQIASLRFKQVMAKVGNFVADGVKDIVVDILSEAAKKAIWGS